MHLWEEYKIYRINVMTYLSYQEREMSVKILENIRKQMLEKKRMSGDIVERCIVMVNIAEYENLSCNFPIGNLEIS